jgi:tetratricopeptide (TPR) repeat protein
MLLPLLMLVAATGATEADRGRYAACLALTHSDPVRAIATAQAWRVENGGTGALHCLALAQFERRDYPAAFASYDLAVKASLTAGDGQVVVLLAQAADAALIAGQPERALGFLDRALASGSDGAAISPRVEASLRSTRAEALVDLKRDKDAGADLARATTIDPQNADGWLLQATLARRMGDLALAETAILKAGELAPDNAEVQYEAGTIAAVQGRMDLARTAWTAAAAADPDSVAGVAAASALKEATKAPLAAGGTAPGPQL